MKKNIDYILKLFGHCSYIFLTYVYKKERLGKLFLLFVFKEGEDDVFHLPPKPKCNLEKILLAGKSERHEDVCQKFLSSLDNKNALLVELINYVLRLQRLLPGKLLIYTVHNYLESAFFVNS